MGWYANLKIAYKLLLGFASVIIICGLIGLAGISGMKNIDATVTRLNDTILTQVIFANEAHTNLILHNRRLYRHILAHDVGVLQQTASQMQLNEMAIKEVFERHRKTSIPPAEAAIIDRFDRLWPEYLSMQERVLNLSAAGKKDLAFQIADNEGRTLFKQLDEILADLIRFNVAEAKGENDNAHILYHSLRYWLIALILGSIALGVGMAYFITRSVVKPVTQVLEAMRTLTSGSEEKARLAEAIAAGDLDQEAVITEQLQIDSSTLSRDEAGKLLRTVVAMNEVQAKLDSAFARMTKALRSNRETENASDWLKSGLNDLNTILRGDKPLAQLADQVLNYLAEYLKVGAGSFYLCDQTDQELSVTATYALSRRKSLNSRIKLGEGLAGQAALEKKLICLTNVPGDYLPIESTIGAAAPCNILALPLVREGKLVGVLEFGSFQTFTDQELEFLQQASESLAIAINVNQARQVVNTLLAQTQTQTEELQTQQEELQQTNEELEERAQMLEQQREQIKAKNREVEEASRQLQRKAEELERVSTYKSEFLANMSHELRTPLNSLMILSGILKENKDGNLSVKQVEYAATIKGAGEDLLNLINDILDLSKIESGRLDFHYETVQFTQLAEQVKTLFTPVAEQKGLDFTATVDALTPASIQIDGQRTLQIIKNLLSNACKFTTQGSVQLRIYLPDAAENPFPYQTVAFAVKDSGIGIPASKQEHVFQAFAQADGSTSRNFGGTGLGLSISRQLARGMSGDITLTSQEGAGSLFTLYLPATANDSAKKTPLSANMPVAVPTKPLVSSAPLPADNESPVDFLSPAPLDDDRGKIQKDDKSILIIEDDLSFAKILMDLVRERGFAAIVAADGESGISLADCYQPSAILLDVMLPHIDGWGVMRTLKDNARTRHIPIHVVTCLDERQKAMALGAIGFVTKPVSNETLNEIFGTIEQSVDKTLKKLLIVEDNETEAQSMVILLEERSVNITVATSGQQAIATLAREPFDCIVLDLGLTDMSGFDLLEHIAQLDAKRRIPVIIHSGKDLSHEDEVNLRRYAERIIIKGAKSPERLLNEVSLFLHLVETNLPVEKQQMIRTALDKEAMFAGKKVLIADDDMRNIFSLSSVLAEKDMIVFEAENGHEAIEVLQQNPDIDLILMDIMMPVMDGYEAIRSIRQDHRFTSLPIIALTAKAMKGDQEACLKAGASDYTTKPVDMTKLFSLMRVWLYRHE